MAQVHEISRAAFEQLPKHDHANGYGDYLVVGMHATFGRAGRVLHVVENFDSEYWACRRCDGMNANSLFSGLVAADCIYEYEVWHILDDATEPCAVDLPTVRKSAYGDIVLLTSKTHLIEEIWDRYNEDWALFAGYSTEYGCDYLVVPQRLWDECGQTVEGLLA